MDKKEEGNMLNKHASAEAGSIHPALPESGEPGQSNALDAPSGEAAGARTAPVREYGFYWVRLEGRVIPAEFRDWTDDDGEDLEGWVTDGDPSAELRIYRDRDLDWIGPAISSPPAASAESGQIGPYKRALEKMCVAMPVAERVLRDDLLRALLKREQLVGWHKRGCDCRSCQEVRTALTAFVRDAHA